MNKETYEALKRLVELHAYEAEKDYNLCTNDDKAIHSYLDWVKVMDWIDEVAKDYVEEIVLPRCTACGKNRKLTTDNICSDCNRIAEQDGVSI